MVSLFYFVFFNLKLYIMQHPIAVIQTWENGGTQVYNTVFNSKEEYEDFDSKAENSFAKTIYYYDICEYYNMLDLMTEPTEEDSWDGDDSQVG